MVYINMAYIHTHTHIRGYNFGDIMSVDSKSRPSQQEQ